MTYDEIKGHVEVLSENEKKELSNYLQFIVTFGTEHETSAKLIAFDHQQSDCPKCKSESVRKNGFFRGKQRYICKDCGASFNDFTNTFLYHNKIPIDKWLKFCTLFLQSKPLIDTADELELSVSTVFYMRHKLLDAIATSFNEVLSDIIQADETFLAVSFKGQEIQDDRGPRRRGKQVRRRGISNDQTCIAVAIDSQKNMLIKPICRGRVQIAGLQEFFANHVKAKSILCTDGASAYKQIAHDHNLAHHQYKDRNQFDQYHINHINALHSNFKSWIIGFRGVSTKYLAHYANWFKLLRYLNDINSIQKVRVIIERAMRSHVYKTHMEIASRAMF